MIFRSGGPSLYGYHRPGIPPGAIDFRQSLRLRLPFICLDYFFIVKPVFRIALTETLDVVALVPI